MVLNPLTLTLVVVVVEACIGDYKEKNPFVPAEPGHTPKCAKLGTSYCEYVDNYPE